MLTAIDNVPPAHAFALYALFSRGQPCDTSPPWRTFLKPLLLTSNFADEAVQGIERARSPMTVHVVRGANERKHFRPTPHLHLNFEIWFSSFWKFIPQPCSKTGQQLFVSHPNATRRWINLFLFSFYHDFLHRAYPFTSALLLLHSSPITCGAHIWPMTTQQPLPHPSP